MPKHLLIVESPAKAKTIEKILGKDFIVKSSYGHIRDLEKNTDAVDVKNHFTPKYVVSPDKKKVVKELKSWVKKVDDVWLATDEDREGEAISWHLCKVLSLDPEETKRIAFREITAPAIKKAIDSPRKVDINLVNAQQARRILDRLVGYELSEILWRKVKGKLSAGRVQSVAVKLIVDREREINAFEPTPFFKVMATFLVKNEYGKLVELQAELDGKISRGEEVASFLDLVKDASYKINNIEVKPAKRNPSAPFTTSTLQQEASRKLGFSVKRTMMVAQRLYEAGHITYMRTDSTNLSEVALKNIAQEIRTNFGDRYLKTRRFKSKKQLTQEAHEAIRPTYIERTQVSTDRSQQRLYELIWKRTVASQMAQAELERTTVKIGMSTVPDRVLIATGEVLKFDGFLKVYLESKDEDNGEETKGMLPPLKVDQPLDFEKMEGVQRFSKPPARYTEASLVKKLEELGIGRPSTYAPIISKIMEADRGYVTKESRPGVERLYEVFTLEKEKISKKVKTEFAGATKNRLYPSDVGMIVTDFLTDNFQGIMNYGFTAEMEGKFDHIAAGKIIWTKMLDDFYFPFHDLVENTMENSKRERGERVLGKEESTGHSVMVKLSRFGRPMVQIGTKEEVGEDEKPRFANLKPGQSIESINFEEAMELFKLPMKLGTYKDEDVIVNTGRYGPYIKYKGAFISLGKNVDPFEVKLDAAIELIEQKNKENAPIGTYQNLPITRGKGRFGPFLKWNEKYINIPKKYVPEDLSFEECVQLIKDKIEKDAKRFIHQWSSEGLSLENGRWGAFIKYKKKNFKIPKKADGSKYEPEELKELTKEDIYKMIEDQAPGTIKKKGKAKVK